MTRKQIKQLHAGDEVKWNDPDGGLCSKHLIINEIELKGDTVCITAKNGDYLECYPNELE